jgi:predicted DNA-binding protein YlxM (UPF0122 family)
MKKIEMVYLYDLYAPLLNDRQREVLELYYNEDQSLAEISENVGITRQGVRDCIVKSEALLAGYEDALGLRAKLLDIEKRLDDLTRKAENGISGKEISDEIAEIKNMLL